MDFWHQPTRKSSIISVLRNFRGAFDKKREKLHLSSQKLHTGSGDNSVNLFPYRLFFVDSSFTPFGTASCGEEKDTAIELFATMETCQNVKERLPKTVLLLVL